MRVRVGLGGLARMGTNWVAEQPFPCGFVSRSSSGFRICMYRVGGRRRGGGERYREQQHPSHPNQTHDPTLQNEITVLCTLLRLGCRIPWAQTALQPPTQESSPSAPSSPSFSNPKPRLPTSYPSHSMPLFLQ